MGARHKLAKPRTKRFQDLQAKAFVQLAQRMCNVSACIFANAKDYPILEIATDHLSEALHEVLADIEILISMEAINRIDEKSLKRKIKRETMWINMFTPGKSK